MNKRKLLLETAFLILVMGLTIAALLKNGGPSVFIHSLSAVSPGYVLCAIGLLMAYILLESVIIKIIMHALDEQVSLCRCAKYSFAGFFFYCISPAGSAEQPVQLYYMHKDGIDASKSVFALAVITLTFKFALLMLGGFTCLIMPDTVTDGAQIFLLFTAGCLLTALAIIGCSLMLFIPDTMEGAALAAAGLLSRMHLIGDPDKLQCRIVRFTDKYRQTHKLCKSRCALILTVLAVTLVQRLALMAVTAVSCIALGAPASEWPELTLVQSIIGASTEMLPLPGGLGANEYVYINVLRPMLGDITLPSLILSRGVSFYCQLIICGAVTGIIALFMKIKGNEK